MFRGAQVWERRVKCVFPHKGRLASSACACVRVCVYEDVCFGFWLWGVWVGDDDLG